MSKLSLGLSMSDHDGPERLEHEYGHTRVAHDHAHKPHGHCAHTHHNHTPKTFGRAFAIGAALNIALVFLQVAYGIFAHSMALLADAAHNLGDVLGLLAAWGAYLLARWHPTERYTYGFRSTSILAALFNAAVLLIATGGIIWAAVQRVLEPQAVAGTVVMIVAAIGIGINGLTAWLLAGSHTDLNIRGAYLHMLADAGVAAGVVVAGLIVFLTSWSWVDPATGLIISALIIWSTWGLLRQSVNMSLQAVPAEIEPKQVRRYLESLSGVGAVHDLHVWSMSTTEVALTCHLVMPQGYPGGDFLVNVDAELHRRFGIGHPTIQIELGDRECRLAPMHVV